jgi:methionyl-tRNA formyltransferase
MRVVFMGTPAAAVPTLNRILADGHDVAAIYTQPDRPSGRGNRISFSPVKECSVEHGIEVYQPLKIRTDDAIDEFRSLKADVAVVVAYGRILPAAYLEAFPMGAINVHFSLLPKYRGAAPVNWSIVNGEKETGVTTMRMDEGLDTGEMLLQRSTPIGPDENAIGLTERLSTLGADLLSETLFRYRSITPTPQDDTLASLAPILKKDDGRIDWHLTATEIANRVRGFQPFPTAYTSLRGAKVTLWQAKRAEIDEDNSDEPGTVISSHGGELLIRCGAGTVLSISELQVEGKRRLATRDFLNGISVSAGEILG